MKFTYRCGGLELKKVALYYGLLDDESAQSTKIVCPFHEDINPSMIMDFDKGTYFCFGCQKSGDAISFVLEVNKKMSQIEALKLYFKILKSRQVKKLDIGLRYKNKVANKQYYDEASDYYYGLPNIDWSEDKFEEVSHVRKYMLDRGFTIKTLNKAKAKVTFNKNYPIIFPLLDNGTFRGYVSRTTTKEVEKKRKYLYNKGFTRRDTLAGKYKNGEIIFIVEGYMDKLKLEQLGCKYVLAILGWKMSGQQIEKLRSTGIKHVVSALDNDIYGKRGSIYLEGFFKVTRWQYISGIKDPGDFTKSSYKKMLNRTMRIMKEKTK